ncbi:E3 ubiquitin-protein ligase TRIM7-like isoform X2 [Eublepharis macularius]|uniref:E3 ubiquitin-protein ligase TRIM7-like isoform X2 n=1 Tax=Eublepharis macularius TaxID=481883 RepID=A0AA97KVT2_EUBMA|nr:E3 ubiquitin-protein ligase TRIM7-like isoform X2 [Eublepharis macularius]
MAAGGPLQDLCKKATCSICLEFFKDPVTITECDHNFCRGCLTGSWGESATEASCPQCKGKAQPGGLCPNLRLANVVEIAKKFTCQGGKEALCVKHEEPLELFCKVDEAPICLVCDRSKEHRFHVAIPLEEAFQENKTVIKAEERRVCEKHQEPLKLFCKDDGALMCLNCDRSKEHNYHEVIPIEEAAQEYKDQVCRYLEILKKERENMLAHKVDAIKESQDVLRKTKEEKEKAVAEFRQLRQFLEQQEKLLLTQMEEVEEEIARRREEHLAELSKELFSLQGLIQEMEEKCQQAASELLQDIGSTLQRYKKFETPEAFPSELRWRIWDFCDLHHFLEGVMKQFKATLMSGPPKQKVDVTLDPDTANSFLILSEDRKSVRCGNKVQSLPYNTERFDKCLIVLGCEGFTSGRHFWEVVGNGYGWSVGVARKSVTRKGYATDLKPEFGFWGVKKIDGNFMQIPKLYVGHSSSLPVLLRFTTRKIRVCLNYDKGQVSFFNADTAAHLHTFSGASFNGETVFPFFEVNSNAHFDLSF